MSWFRLFLLSSLLVTTACTATTSGAAAHAPPSYATGEVAVDNTLPSSHASISTPASGEAAGRPTPALERPGLATQWGEAIQSPITMSPFVRASEQPWATLVLHYNSEDGVRAYADYLGGAMSPLEASLGDGALGVALIDDRGQLLPGVIAGGRHLVVGKDGERYQIVIRNTTEARFEIVTSVDGLDVLDGQPASPSRRGYLVDPHDTLVIDGFRRSSDEVAAFRFGPVASSYAARTSGDANVGVIGVAVFAERGAAWTPSELGRRDQADPFPARSYAAPPS